MTIIMCTNGFIPGADPGEVESAESHLPSFFIICDACRSSGLFMRVSLSKPAPKAICAGPADTDRTQHLNSIACCF